jgi:hypothetical protein
MAAVMDRADVTFAVKKVVCKSFILIYCINFLNPELVIREITSQFLLVAALRHGFEMAYSDERPFRIPYLVTALS